MISHSDVRESEFSATQSALLHSVLQQLVDSTGVPGIGAMISINSRRIETYCGTAVLDSAVPLSRSSKFEISCLMKFYVSLLALDLIKKGQLALDDPIGKYLPDLASACHSKANSIRVANLLSHTSGYKGLDIRDAGNKWRLDWSKLVTFLAETPQLFMPGHVFNYEHSEHVILGEIIERITRESVSTLVEQKIYRPLKISASCSKEDKRLSSEAYVGPHIRDAAGRFTHSFMPAPSSFWRASLPATTLTLSDIVTIGEAVMALRVGDIVLETDFGKIHPLSTPVVKLPKVFSNKASEHIPATFGLCCGQYNYGSIGHNGSMQGQTCGFRIVPQARAVVGVCLNVWAPHLRDAILNFLVKKVSGIHGSLFAEPTTVAAADFFGNIAPTELEGTFLGSMHDKLFVKSTSSGVLVTATGGTGSEPLLEAVVEPGGMVILKSIASIPAGFFRDPDDGTPCLTMGMLTYKLSRE